MRRWVLTILAIVSSCALFGQSDRINLYRASMDSVVRMMERRGYGDIYFVEDTAKRPRFTFECSETDFLKVVQSEIYKAGYSISKYGEDGIIRFKNWCERFL